MKSKNAPMGKLILYNCLGIAAGVTIVPGLALGNLLYNRTLNRQYNRIDFGKLLSDPEESQECPSPGAFARNPDDSEWNTVFDACKEREMTSFDGLKLHAYQIENPGARRQVIMVHGYGADHMMYRQLAKHFYNTGFSILMPDLRGHGNSEGNVICMGWKDRLDIIKWIDLLVSENPQCEIVLYGISMGAATVMMTSGEKLPVNVKAVIEDCGYTSAAEQFGYCLRTFFHVVPFPLLYFSGLVCRLRGGWGFWQANAVKQLQKNRLPMLFIHGADDDFVPAFMIDKVYAASMGPKEKFIVPGAKHAEACCVDPEGYGKAVEGFLKKYLN